jgi:hypothetical protein
LGLDIKFSLKQRADSKKHSSLSQSEIIEAMSSGR